YRETVKKRKEQHKNASDKIGELEQTKEQQDSVFQENEKAYEREKAVFDDRVQKVPEDVRVLSVLNEKIKQTETTKKMMEQAWELVQKQLQTAEQNLTKAETNVTNAQKQVKESAKKLQEAEQQFTDAIKEAQF